MFLKLITTTILVMASTMANATLITGNFGITGTANTTLNAAGEVTAFEIHNIEFSSIRGDFISFLGHSLEIDYAPDYLKFDVSSLSFDRNVDLGQLSFNPIRVDQNKTVDGTTSLSIIGLMSAPGFSATETEWYFSTQRITPNDSIKTFSGFIEAPAAASVPEPESMAIFALGFAGLVLSRKKSA